MLKYRGYTFQRVRYQGTVCYKLFNPMGYSMGPELAASLKTARHWVDCHLSAVSHA